jgi:DNA-directed RNA polymerase subunit RPC12/RpoP
MSAKLECPHCGERFPATDDIWGRTIACPNCGGDVIVPERPRPAKEARVIMDDDGLSDPGPLEDNVEEREIFNVNPAWRAFLGWIILGALLSVVVVGLLILLWVWLKTISLNYRLTTQRLFVRQGIISRRIDELELFRVKDVRVIQSFWQRLIGYGTVLVISTDDLTPNVALIGLTDPVEIKEHIREHFKEARRRERVRAHEFIES